MYSTVLPFVLRTISVYHWYMLVKKIRVLSPRLSTFPFEDSTVLQCNSGIEHSSDYQGGLW